MPSMSELEKRKKLLIAEAEVYRQMLKLEVYNLQIYGIKTKRRFTSFSPRYNPMVSLGIPIISSLIYRKRRRSLKDFGVLALLGLQLYNKFGSIFRGSAKTTRISTRPTAAEDYLSRAI
jgi:hypothetical protein